MKKHNLIFIAIGLGVLYFLSQNQSQPIPTGSTVGATATPQLQALLTTTLQNNANAGATVPVVSAPITTTLQMESIA